MAPLPHRRPPFRADHVGSLLRPQPLREAFRRHAAGEIGDAEFAAVQDRCIRDVVSLQEQVGLQVVTDGEFRRGSYWGRFVERTAGFETRSAVFKFRNDQGEEVEFTAPYAGAKIARRQPLALDEYDFLRGATKVTGKITLPAPSTMHFYRCTDYADRTVYPDTSRFFADLVAVFQQEMTDLAKAGCRYIQLDEVAVALLCDQGIRAQVKRAGSDPDALVGLYIDAINEAVSACPPDAVVGVHMCRGNFKGRYLAAGGYERVAERFFAETNVNHFLLEYDTPRAGDFAPLRYLPAGKRAYLGIISTKNPVLEAPDELMRRLDDAARHAPMERLGICPQCGFASAAMSKFAVLPSKLTTDIQTLKIQLLIETGRRAWGHV
jgi:5-methyltetrahydropteroyltriglutamate--homocysteine methyltransferase